MEVTEFFALATKKHLLNKDFGVYIAFLCTFMVLFIIRVLVFGGLFRPFHFGVARPTQCFLLRKVVLYCVF